MKTVDEIHRLNLRILANEVGGPSNLARKLGRDNAQVSQWLNGSTNSGTGRPRGMGARSCRLVEDACGKPNGWMDIEHADTFGEKKQVSQDLQYQFVTAREAALLSNFRTVNDKGRGMIEDLADNLEKVITPAAAGNQPK